MKSTTFYRLFLFIAPVIFSVFSLIASAQTQHVFKKGDRVLVSPLSLKDDKYWRPGTVTDVNIYAGKYAYTVACDPETQNGSASSFVVHEEWIKPLPAANENANTNNHAQTQTVNSTTAQTTTTQKPNTTVACPPSDPNTKGKTALEQSLRGAVRTDFEREPQPGEDGRVTVTFQNFSIGQPHAYRDYEDPSEAKGTTIYPVNATFTTCTDYNTRIVTLKRERAFSCYKNTAGEWVCDVTAAANTNVKDETKSIEKPKQ
ncbi:MAG TPA: hypothetical protein VHB70_19740 [Parafilimonas sp.]|nr:hypothetical protein [Parafilimonas sp.]